MTPVQIGCDSCGSGGPARYAILERRICNACYSRLRRHPGQCPGCRQVKVLAFYDSDRRVVCASCAGAPPRFGCTSCGSEDQLTGSQCGTCRLTDRLREVLSDKHGRIHPDLASLHEHLLTARDPRSATRWLRREPIGETLRAMATGQAAISHDTLNALPLSPRVRYLRRMLISAGTLSAIDVELNDFELKATAFIAGLPDKHAAILKQYFTWEILRKLRQRATTQPVTASTANSRYSELRKIAGLLAWLDDHGLSLSTLNQAALDRFFAEHDYQSVHRTFLNWAVRHHLTGPVAVPGRKPPRPDASVPDEVIWSKIDLLLEDRSIPLPSRIIGLFILVFAQRLCDCVRLRRTDVVDDKGEVSIAFGKTPVVLPASITSLLRQHLDESRAERPFAGGGSEWLFAGAMPQHHTSEANVALHLSSRGIRVREVRRARIDQLVQQVPASVVADVVGINIATALKHAANTNSTWGTYPELRATTTEE